MDCMRASTTVFLDLINPPLIFRITFHKNMWGRFKSHITNRSGKENQLARQMIILHSIYLRALVLRFGSYQHACIL